MKMIEEGIKERAKLTSDRLCALSTIIQWPLWLSITSQMIDGLRFVSDIFLIKT